MTDASSRKRSRRDVVMLFFESINTGDVDVLGEALTDDCVSEYPQSGERIVGRGRIQDMLRHYPGRIEVDRSKASIYGGEEGHYLLTPMFTAVKVEAEGDTLVSSVKSRYPDGSDWFIIAISHFRGEKVAKQVMYFAPAFEAPEWRKPWVEPMGERS